ncbi:hypothetical protein J6590_061637 [Homalodisca vitripennis]|nr:hypothetical protein J6590_061637 [Homalodisca vitripennis]
MIKTSPFYCGIGHTVRQVNRRKNGSALLLSPLMLFGMFQDTKALSGNEELHEEGQDHCYYQLQQQRYQDSPPPTPYRDHQVQPPVCETVSSAARCVSVCTMVSVQAFALPALFLLALVVRSG